MRQPHPDDVLLSLGHVTTPDGPRTSLYAEVADTDRRLLTVTLHPEQLAQLLAARVIFARSETPLQHPPVAADPVFSGPWLNVTLHATSNRYLQLPCNGQLQVLEAGTDGSVIHAVFRRREPDGSLSAPVEVRDARWSYGASTSPAPAAVPPGQQPEICGAVGKNGYRCGMWRHTRHAFHVYNVPPPVVAVVPVADAETVDAAREIAGVTFPYLGLWRSADRDDSTRGRARPLLHLFSAEPPALVLACHGYVPAGKGDQ